MLPLLLKHYTHYFIIAGSIRDQAYYQETINFLNKKLVKYEILETSIRSEEQGKLVRKEGESEKESAKEFTMKNSITLRENVKIMDFLLHPDYLSALREASLVMNTSVSEGMSGSILEAFGAKVPVLARKNEGNCFLMQNGVNGGIFETSKEFEEWYEILIGERRRRGRRWEEVERRRREGKGGRRRKKRGKRRKKGGKRRKQGGRRKEK
jgi:glycosyltransferase involved in cell wall biosynthesis